jgi:hypothetical protein
MMSSTNLAFLLFVASWKSPLTKSSLRKWLQSFEAPYHDTSNRFKTLYQASIIVYLKRRTDNNMNKDKAGKADAKMDSDDDEGENGQFELSASQEAEDKPGTKHLSSKTSASITCTEGRVSPPCVM